MGEVLGAHVDDLRREAQPVEHIPQELEPLVERVDEREPQVRPRDEQRNAGKARARPDVHGARALREKAERDGRQAVEEVPVHGLFRFEDGGEVHARIALDEERMVERKALGRLRRERDAHLQGALLYAFRDHGFLSLLICSSLIISTAMSPGETPEILCAAPSVSGRILSSFCCASMRRPLMSE